MIALCLLPLGVSVLGIDSQVKISAELIDERHVNIHWVPSNGKADWPTNSGGCMAGGSPARVISGLLGIMVYSTGLNMFLHCGNGKQHFQQQRAVY